MINVLTKRQGVKWSEMAAQSSTKHVKGWRRLRKMISPSLSFANCRSASLNMKRLHTRGTRES